TERRVTFTPQYSGLNGQAVTFSAAGLMPPTTSPGPYTRSIFTDNPTVTLQAEQSGTTVSYAYSWLAACNNNPSARSAAEPLATAPLTLRVLGNPVITETATVEIQGGAGQRLQLRLIDGRGNTVSESVIHQAQRLEQHQIKLSGHSGLYLLRVSTPTHVQTIKIYKQ
ncbi:MAG: hypothetical protein JWP57_3402, partial [Spirosoma sp.]|nr:hypothetical protein [Spirosoma sp.]